MIREGFSNARDHFSARMITWSLHSWVDSIFRGCCCHRGCCAGLCSVCLKLSPLVYVDWGGWCGDDSSGYLHEALSLRCSFIRIAFICLLTPHHWKYYYVPTTALNTISSSSEWNNGTFTDCGRMSEWVSEFSGVEAAEASSDGANHREQWRNG